MLQVAWLCGAPVLHLAVSQRLWTEAPHVGVLHFYPFSSLYAYIQTINTLGWLHLFAACCMSGTLYVLLLSIGCQWLYTCSKRSSMRAQYNLQESPCLDCCVHFWCDTCALCQEYRELEKRGFNMAKGIPPIEGKIEKRNYKDTHMTEPCSSSFVLQDGKVATRWWGVYKGWGHHESNQCASRALGLSRVCWAWWLTVPFLFCFSFLNISSSLTFLSLPAIRKRMAALWSLPSLVQHSMLINFHKRALCLFYFFWSLCMFPHCNISRHT